MSRKMRSLGLAVVCCFVLSIAFFQTPSESYGSEDITIQVSPSTLNIQSKGKWVTVHVDIAFDTVDAENVELNGIPISWATADDQGNFVAKFERSDVQDLIEAEVKKFPANYDVTLTGQTKEGGAFEGGDTIKVISSRKHGK